MADTITVDFNSLPRGVRDRFVAITKGAAPPAPVLWQKTSTKSKVVGLSFLLVLLAIVALFVVVAGFGDAWTELGVHEPLFVVVFYLPVAFVVLFVALTIARRLVVGSPFPFEPGRYLFPTDFVDARNATLRIVPTRSLTNFEGVHMHTNGSYTHTLLTFRFADATEQFSVRGKDAAQAATNAFWAGQQAVAAAAQAQDWQTIASLDPFFECRRTGIWQDTSGQAVDPGSRVKPVPAFFRWRAAVAALVALVTCPVVALARNLASDEVMFASVKRADSENAYDVYVRNGWRHVEEAKLARPVAAFREAKEKGTVSAIRHVLKAYPNSSVESDARAALHELYASTLRTFRTKASTSDPRLLPFMEQLISYLERNDTATVRVVFSPPTAGTLSQADAEFARKYSGGGRVVEPISPYFGEARSAPRERTIVDQLNKAFASIFPTDVLTLEQADATGKEPSISIAYAVGPSGDAYQSRDGNRVFVGIDVGFTMLMTIPDAPGALDFKLKVSPPDEFEYHYAPGSNQAEAAYTAMAERAFDEFSTKLEGVFFKS
jgi:hypothetical protein